MNKSNIAIIGLGYVGLPLAIEFGKIFNTIGFDINKRRIKELIAGKDSTKEISKKELLNTKYLQFSNQTINIRKANIYIICVPTPIYKNKKPNLKYLFDATKLVAKLLKKNDLIIYESTVYPGLTEEECVPILENISGMQYNKDFFCGYSPERINPGDKKHGLKNICKITSGSTPRIANKVDNLYKKIARAGTYKVSSIRIAEAAKIIENIQRDINIALINEISMVFDKMNIDTQEVLNAAATKWNFLNFKPGLVGGHCIGIDPYYLTYQSKKFGVNPKVILAGRNVNDNMSMFLVKKLLREMFLKKINIKKSKILVLGLTFKENCSDVRNSKVIEVVNLLKKLKAKVDIHDPIANKLEVKNKYKIKLINLNEKNKYDVLIFAVAHKKFKNYKKFTKFTKEKNIIFDIKYLFGKNTLTLTL
ncbi:nucleotide sugar dehydrogenase [Alphaproteobacteria bacterium]|nr:nucleotide sugar dehydrogenase [Alphaproteobacteria bacterium]